MITHSLPKPGTLWKARKAYLNEPDNQLSTWNSIFMLVETRFMFQLHGQAWYRFDIIVDDRVVSLLITLSDWYNLYTKVS